MEGKSPEFIPTKQEATDRGFSEKRTARILEGKRMDNSQVKKRKPLILPFKQKILKRAARTQLSRREKILQAHEANTKEIIKLVKMLGLLAKGSIHQEEQLMIEIRARQRIQDLLLNALVLDNTGQTLPKAVEDLIK